jgi:hypothetical protein
MNTYKSLAVLIVAIISSSSAHAYKARVTNNTTGNITTSINLAACRPIQVGVLKPGETSTTFDTGACCFESINATGTSGASMNISSGNVRPWGPTWQCFHNLHFTVSEKVSNGKVTSLIIDEKSF